ncbi:Glycosyltransferase involved in cell wall bisynthesis [Daejeonella rubra]|uniref:Glycosyltransferase involved in cell wall bisynthesis n=1 Tax=Daejeonella rubra TaxID=990371 RepID=A0A1G9WXH4_9SPHI|nr:glycosyltransferase family 4 protein [Daejeonella rubra]SDM88793.1 Glycosyltransferase involved in cell wall bisynthesis [Daejeonella rubra]
MKILFIAPLPPPLGGHSLVSQVLLDGIKTKHNVEVVNFNKTSFVQGVNSFKRIFQILGVLKDVWIKKKNVEVVYLTISQSLAGNLKDIFMYVICGKKISDFYIHLHGGSIKRELWDSFPLLWKINKYFISRMAGAIVSGKSHISVFEDILPKSKIHIVPNFALDYLFVEEQSIYKNFTNSGIIRILYMSNMIEKKGYNELADAYIKLDHSHQQRFELNFAGRFELESQKDAFLSKISGYSNIHYHGVVNDDQKKRLFEEAHLLCLPTAFFEGQPVAILEAYASGCAVIVTGQSGILDIFEDKKNGFQVQERSSDSIKAVIENQLNDIEELKYMALENRKLAIDKYRVSNYVSSLNYIMESHKKS